jgi:hypothetical protein
MKFIIEGWDKFMSEEESGKTTAGDYRAQVMTDKGDSGTASGVDDLERNLLMNLQKKLATAAKYDSIATGPILMLADKLSAQLDIIIAKHQKK